MDLWVYNAEEAALSIISPIMSRQMTEQLSRSNRSKAHSGIAALVAVAIASAPAFASDVCPDYRKHEASLEEVQPARASYEEALAIYRKSNCGRSGLKELQARVLNAHL